MLTHCSLLFCGSVKNLNFTSIDALKTSHWPAGDSSMELWLWPEPHSAEQQLFLVPRRQRLDNSDQPGAQRESRAAGTTQ